MKWSYETESRLIGTPSLLNVDDSNELEIIVAGYSSNQDNFYIFSANGSLIDQIEISEKIKSGFAIADLDENGYDDIVFGTDDDNLYLIYDGNQIAPGFPFQGIDKFIYNATEEVIDKFTEEFRNTDKCEDYSKKIKENYSKKIKGNLPGKLNVQDLNEVISPPAVKPKSYKEQEQNFLIKLKYISFVSLETV